MVAVLRTHGFTHRANGENHSCTKHSHRGTTIKNRVVGLRTRAKRDCPTRSISTEHWRYQRERHSSEFWILFARLTYCGLSCQLSYNWLSQISARRSRYRFDRSGKEPRPQRRVSVS